MCIATQHETKKLNVFLKRISFYSLCLYKTSTLVNADKSTSSFLPSSCSNAVQMSKMKKLKGSFRYTQWDPCLITSQIVAMQSVLYLSLCLLIAIMQDLTGSTRTLDHIFEYHEIHVRDSEGRSVILAFVLNAIIGAFVMWNVVGRTKLCLDFSCTYYGMHLVACWMYNGTFPTTFSWWILNIACGAITCVAGEFLCLRTELQAIPLSNIGAKVDL